jgi:1,4-dihydroxy-2-naphthoate octaprenyltransferase
MSREAARPGALRRAVLHLRLPFSLVLSPLYLWGAYLALPAPLDWLRLGLGYFVVHGLLYGGMNAYNSYWDRDEGPIGALADPPPVDRSTLAVGVAAKGAALVLALALGLRFAALAAAAAALSVLYSHPRWRWKERPPLAALTVFVGQGVLGVLWGWTAAAPARGLGGTELAGVAGAALWTLGFYALTGVYQIEGDVRRGVTTLAVALGVDGSFGWAAALGVAGGLTMGAVLVARGDGLAALAAAGYLAGGAAYAAGWRRRFARQTARQNQRALMRLGYANGLFFGALFLLLLLLLADRRAG